MGKKNDQKPITPESVLEAVKEMFAVSRKEYILLLKHDRAKFQQEMKQSRTEFQQEMKQLRADRAKRKVEFQQEIKQSREEFQQEMKQTRAEQAKRSAAIDMKLDRLTEQVAGVTKSNGLFAEDYFLNSFRRDDLNFFGEQFDKVVRGKGTIAQDEYDFVLINGKTACIVEVKYKARKDDINKALKKIYTFRINFPEYNNHKLFLAIAALSINESLERECNRQGIAVIKQVGEKVVVYDKNLKVF